MKVALVYPNIEKHVARGAGYIASAILAAGHDLDYYDTTYHPIDTIISDIPKGGYDLLAISASTLFMRHTAQIAAGVKQLSNLKILVGGVHAIIVKGDILRDYPEIDYICVGEGEDFIVDFLRAIENGDDVESIDNLGYRSKDSAIVVNPVRPCTNLDTLPPFRYDIFHPESVVQNLPLPGFCYVYATRGCPYNCSYCSNGAYLDLYHRNYLRTRNVDDTIAELIYLRENYPIQFFYFGDEMIIFDEAYVTELFHRVTSEVRIPFGCMARVERITPAIVDLIKESGCRYVAMGVECGDEEFRKKFLNRHMTNKQIIDAFAALRAIKGMVLTSFSMKGYPVPYDAQLLEKTHALNKLIKADIVQMSVVYPFPGTKIYDYCVKHDLIDRDKFEQAEDVFSVSAIKNCSLEGETHYRIGEFS